jgi:L-ascorbate metabolism protein UlaG (beta-lactamase superfamily)
LILCSAATHHQYPEQRRAFEGTNTYGVNDLPEIDYLLISHDHYDHLDYSTIKELKGKVKNVICGLGVGSIF